MKAQEARQIANLKYKPVYDSLIKNKVRAINKLIEEAASNGRFSLYYNEYVSKDVIGQLEENGFTVKTYSNLMDSENSNSIQISW